MFEQIARPVGPTYTPTRFNFIAASFFIAAILLTGVRWVMIATAHGEILGAALLCAVVALMVVGWVRVFLAYREIRRASYSGDSALTQRYRTQLKRVMLPAAILLALSSVGY